MENEFIKQLRDVLFPSVLKTGDTEKDKQIAISTFINSLGRLLGGFQVERAGSTDDAELIERAKIPKAPSFRRSNGGTEAWTTEDGQTVRGIRDPRQMIKFKEVQKIQPLPTPNNLRGGRGF